MMIPEWVIWGVGVFIGVPLVMAILFFAYIGILVLKNL